MGSRFAIVHNRLDLPPMRSTNWTPLDIKAQAEGEAVRRLAGMRIVMPSKGRRLATRPAALRA